MSEDSFKELLEKLETCINKAKENIDENFNLMSEDQISARDIAQDSKDAIINIKEAYSKLNEHVRLENIGDVNE